jgi:hypothetical protein
MTSRVAEGSVEVRHERAWSLVMLAASSAVAAVLVPPAALFWTLAAAIAAVAAAAMAIAALVARGQVERDLDAELTEVAGEPRGAALRQRAERISSPRHRRLVARRLEALIARAEVVPNRECFHVGLVRLHRTRLRRIATTVRREGPVPTSVLARLNGFLWDPASPLVCRPADPQRFSAWLRQIEIDLE